MKIKFLSAVGLAVSLLFSALVSAQSDYGYFGFNSDIVTNYIRKGYKIGYVRITAEIMINGNSNLELVEHHAPLLEAEIVNILGKQPEEKIKSLAGREEIRIHCLEAINKLLERETGARLATDLLFTKYLYQ